MTRSFHACRYWRGVGEPERSPIHTMRILQVIIIGMTLLASGCSRAPSLAAKVQTAGGSAALLQDCQAILAEHQRSQKEFWSRGDSTLPPTIAALQPQTVQAFHYNNYPMVDIQVLGGFNHHGLMVILTSTPPGFMPRKSSWSVTKIADDIFDYRE